MKVNSWPVVGNDGGDFVFRGMDLTGIKAKADPHPLPARLQGGTFQVRRATMVRRRNRAAAPSLQVTWVETLRWKFH